MGYSRKKQYLHQSPNVNAFGNSCYEFLREKYNVVPDYILAQLDQAVNFMQLVEDCRKQIAEDGLTVINTKGVLSAHPLLTVMKEASTQVHKFLTGLLLTPNSLDKQRKSDHTEENIMLKELLGE